MQRTVTYLYPDANKASHLKVFQDRTNQIKAFYFTKENIKEIEKMPTAQNYAVYFLFDNSEEGANKVYVGQSMNGIIRIFEHARGKDFWTFCIMFVTDNDSFDKLSIDFIEYEFIKEFKKSSYVLMNKDLRPNEPNISIYDKPNLLAYIEQIKFLLNAEGIAIDEDNINAKAEQYYYPKNRDYKAKVFIRDGKFVLAKGSELRRPIESSKSWKNKHYARNNSVIEDYFNDGKVKVIDGRIIAQRNLSFNSPSSVANLISGSACNGWTFFENLNDLRTIGDERGE